MNTQEVINLFYQKLQTIPDILILKNAATPQTIPETGLIMIRKLNGIRPLQLLNNMTGVRGKMFLKNLQSILKMI